MTKKLKSPTPPSLANYEARIAAYEMELKQMKKDYAKQAKEMTKLRSLLEKQIY